MGVPKLKPLLLTILVCFISHSTSLELDAILANSQLPYPTGYISSIYDGDDSIYIFGGYSMTAPSSYLTTIHKFQISTDTISIVASFPSPGRYAGGLSSDSEGNFFHFGGFSRSTATGTAFKLTPADAKLQEVANLDANFVYGSVVSHPDPNIAIIIGGYEDHFETQFVRCFNMSSESNCGRTALPTETDFGRNSAFAIGDRAFIFTADKGNEITILNLTSLESTIVPTTLPKFTVDASITTDGTYGYLIGPYYDKPSTPMDSLIRFDSTTLRHEFIHVNNHPGSEWNVPGTAFYRTSTTYVDKLNRIYIFGGMSTVSDYYRDIWYIDLPDEEITTPTEPPISTTEDPSASTTLDPDIFTCDGKPDGFYPHPFECSMFIGCDNGTLEIFSCPPPLLFNPDKGACDFPQFVDCDVPFSCVGKPDGMYPHPSDCSLFIGCFDEVLEIFKCPDPLLFDPDTLTCRYPQDVDCHVK